MKPRRSVTRPVAASDAPKRAPRAPKLAGRDAILAAAISEFADKGYDGASTAGIARSAGVAQPLVHHYFESKEKLWLAVMEALFVVLEELGRSLIDDFAFVDPARQLEMLTRKFVLFTARHPELARIMVREGATPGPRVDVLVERFIRPISSLIQAAYRSGVEQGKMKDLPAEVLFFVVLGAVTHLFTVPAVAEALGVKELRGPDGTRAIADVVTEVVFRGLSRST